MLMYEPPPCHQCTCYGDGESDRKSQIETVCARRVARFTDLTALLLAWRAWNDS
jgi:hypothetical protein